MLDIALFREAPERIIADLAKRGIGSERVDSVIRLDQQWRELIKVNDELKHQRNVVAKEIPVLKKAGEDASEKISQMQAVGENIKANDERMAELLKERDSLRMKIPNLMQDDVPIGKDSSDNVPIRHWGEKVIHDFEAKSHQDLIESLELGNFEKPSKVSGAGFYYLYDGLVLLDLALQRFALDIAMKAGMTIVAPPLMLRKEVLEGLVDLSDFEEVIYKIEDEDLFLIATSEHPLGALHMDEIIPEHRLPLRYAGVSPCFRKEIGAHGVDTRGIFRSHQFNKIEQFSFTTPEESAAEMEFLLKNAQDLFQALEIPYRVVNICTGDLGGTASKKYDIEAWMAKQGEYKEVVSCSNCTSYQARKLNIRVERKDGSREILHTLNSTAIATSRAMVALLENNQDSNGKVKVPKVLVPYMNGKEQL